MAVSEVEVNFGLRRAWRRVFATNDPFAWPFQPDMFCSGIFYPTDGYHLTEEQFTALTRARESVEETSFLLSIVEAPGLSFLDRSWGHWRLDSPSYEQYLELPLTLENTLFSLQGTWGVVISHEMHALPGGDTEFSGSLRQSYAGWARDLRRLEATWAGIEGRDWLDGLKQKLRTG